LIRQQFRNVRKHIATAAISRIAVSGIGQPTGKNGCNAYLANANPKTAPYRGLQQKKVNFWKYFSNFWLYKGIANVCFIILNCRFRTKKTSNFVNFSGYKAIELMCVLYC